MIQRGKGVSIVYISTNLCLKVKNLSQSLAAYPGNLNSNHATSHQFTQPLLQVDWTSVLWNRIVYPDMLRRLRHMSEWNSHFTNDIATFWADPLTSIQGLLRILLQTKEVQKSLPLEKVCEKSWIWFVSRNNFPQCVRAAKKLSEYVNPGFSYNFLHKYQDGKFDARLVLYTIFITNLTVMVLFLVDQYSFFCSCICIRFDFLRLHVNYL